MLFFLCSQCFQSCSILCLFCESQSFSILRCLKMQRCATQEKNITLEVTRQSHHFEQKHITLQNVQGFWLPLHPAKKKSRAKRTTPPFSNTPALRSCASVIVHPHGSHESKQQKQEQNGRAFCVKCCLAQTLLVLLLRWCGKGVVLFVLKFC